MKIIECIRDFCNYSWIYHYAADAVELRKGQLSYDVDDNPQDTEIISVYNVKVQNQPKSAARDYNFSIEDGKETLILKRDPNVDDPQGLTFELILRPSMTATDIDDQLMTDYADVFVAGAKGMLQLVKGKLYSDPANAAINITEYRRGRLIAKTEHYKGRGLNSILVSRIGNTVRKARR